VDELLTEQEVADYCKVSVRTVKRWRAEGTGPPSSVRAARCATASATSMPG